MKSSNEKEIIKKTEFAQMNNHGMPEVQQELPNVNRYVVERPRGLFRLYPLVDTIDMPSGTAPRPLSGSYDNFRKL